MGIENFFNTLVKTKICPKSLLKTIKLECNYLYIDFNSIVYIISDKVETELNYYLYSLIINEKDEKCNQIEDKYNIKLNSLEEFKSYFIPTLVDTIIKNYIYEFIKDICKNMNNPDNIKEIFISIDGTPTMAKISEQKRRKYTNYIMSCMRNNIYKKYGDTIDENRNIYYKNVVSFNKNNSSFWVNNINEIFNDIRSMEFNNDLKIICKNLNNIYISSSNEFGEGEKKILEHITEYKKEGSYVIFSPDSDTVLISLLMHNKLLKLNIQTEFNVLKYDYNENEIENISINILRSNILEFVYSKLNQFRKYNHDKQKILNDIIALFTFFGNDFIPKIESLNIRNGMNIIIDIYIKLFNSSRLINPYLLNNDNNNNNNNNDNITINFEVFINLIDKLADFEDKLIFDKYISIEYKNFNYLLGILESNNYTSFFIDRLNRYCHGFNKVIKYIKSNLDTTAEEVYDNIIDKFTDKDQWIIEFLKIESKNANIIDLLNIMIEKISTSKQYKCGLKFVKYSSTSEDKYHLDHIVDDLIHPKMNVSKYDIEIYKLEKKLDEYQNIGCDNENKIGICELKYKNNEYKIHTDRNIKTKKEFFYKTLLKCKDNNSIYELSNEYIKGFCWTIDYYFNKTDRQININSISTWSYGFNHAPYFKEINNYLNNLTNNLTNNLNELNKLFKDISDINGEYYVKSNQFMNKLEQYIYITPQDHHINIPEMYKEIVRDSELFLNIKDIAERVLNGESDLIDTYDTKFLNKSHIIGLKKTNYNNFMSKCINIRKKLEEN